MFFESAKKKIHAISQNTCQLYYRLRISPFRDILSTSDCVEKKTQKESPQNQNVLWIYRRESVGNTHTPKTEIVKNKNFDR